ncbi:hypothetical protein BDQ12DRAFT_685833 [Crucibulum laeve]|uniref:HMG box domain-containing protein n=1 Tax=Crucibulum laeve TaxID=68775 RepID=A0A5C3LX61_9AGAR|nr:hypothetical protein BDQ12DRAFT_685833 [Crucibulum laeve]
MLTPFALRAVARLSTRTFLAVRSSAHTAILLNTQTRSFLTTSRRESPAKANEELVQVRKVTKTTTKTAVKKPAIKKAAPKKPKVKKAKDKVTVPRGTTPPKGPGGPFMLFFTDFKNRTKPTVTRDEIVELSKSAAAEWHTLSDAQKEVYTKKSGALKEQHDVELKQWLESLDPQVLKELNKRRVKYGKRKLVLKSTGPKRPAGPFFMFLQDFRKEYFIQHPPVAGSTRITESTKVAAEAWRAMAPEAKEVYVKKSAAEWDNWRKTQELEAKA